MNYKKFILAIVAGIAVAGFAACEGTPGKQVVDPALTVAPKELNFEAAGETKTVSVTSELDWTATSEDGWLTIGEAEGEFTVTATANDGDKRTGSITVDNGENTEIIAVTQDAVAVVTDPALTVAPEELNFEAAGETKTVSVTSELDWTATSEDGWLTIDKAEGEFTVTATANDGDKRTGSITVDNGKNTATIAVTQDAGKVVWNDAIQLTHHGLAITSYIEYFGDGNSGIIIRLASYDLGGLDNGHDLWLAIVMPEIDKTTQSVDIAPNKYPFSSGYPYQVFTIDNGSDTVLYYYESGDMKWVAGAGQDITLSDDSSVTIEGDHTGYHMAIELILSNGTTYHYYYDGAMDIDNPFN